MGPDDPTTAGPSIPGDAAGFRRFFDVHRDRVHRLLARLSRCATDADDLLQDTFLTAWRKRLQFRGDGSVEGWLRRIALRTWLNARVRLARARGGEPIDGASEPRAADSTVGLGERLDAADRLARVRAAVDALPDGWREAFVLFRFEGLSCAEIGGLLGVTPKAVERRISRALDAVTRRAVAPEVRRIPLPKAAP